MAPLAICMKTAFIGLKYSIATGPGAWINSNNSHIVIILMLQVSSSEISKLAYTFCTSSLSSKCFHKPYHTFCFLPVYLNV